LQAGIGKGFVELTMNMYSKLKCSVQMDGGISEYF